MNLSTARASIRGLITTFVVLVSTLGLAQAATAAPPVNDAFADAVEIEGSGVEIRGLTVDATYEPGEPVHPSTGGHSVWYRWTATSSQPAKVSACNADFTSVVTIYSGDSLAEVTPVESNSRCAAGFWPVSGDEYRIVVDSEDPDAGTFKLTVATYAPGTNDDFEDAIELTGESVNLSANIVGMTREPGEPMEWTAGSSAWYSWTAPVSGTFTIDLCGSDPDMNLGIFKGASVESLEEVIFNEDGELCGYDPSATFEAEAGTVYRLRIDGYLPEDEGDYDLRLYPGPAQSLTYEFKVAPVGDGTGRIVSEVSDPIFDCGDLCAADVTEGAWLELRAIPDEGSVVAGWRGCQFDSDDYCTLRTSAHSPVVEVRFDKTSTPVDPSEPNKPEEPEEPNKPEEPKQEDPKQEQPHEPDETNGLALRIAALKLEKNRGTATVRVTVNRRSGLRLSGHDLKTVKRDAAGAGTYKLKIVAKGKSLKTLRRKGRVGVTVKITATTGTEQISRKKKVKLRFARA